MSKVISKLQKDLLFELRNCIKYIHPDDIQLILRDTISLKKNKHNIMLILNNNVMLFIDYVGNKYWYMNDKRHRDNDLPAVELIDNSKEYWINGKLHRDNNRPAIEDAFGNKSWFQNGHLIKTNNS